MLLFQLYVCSFSPHTHTHTHTHAHTHTHTTHTSCFCSVESFATKAHIHILNKYTNGNSDVSAAVVADTVFYGAAMEFGGDYRCMKHQTLQTEAV